MEKVGGPSPIGIKKFITKDRWFLEIPKGPMIVRVNQFFTNLLETTTMRMRSCHNFGTIEDTNTIEALTHGGVNVTHSDL